MLEADARSYTDRSVEPGGVYVYTLAVVLPDGQELRSAPQRVELGVPALELVQNYPNPFNPMTTITFFMPEKGPATVSVYDLAGNHVRTLVDELLPAGRNEIRWDGTGANGHPVATGVYFYRLKTTRGVVSKKMILLK